MQIDTMTDTQIAPCLAQGPLAECGRAFTSAAADLGDRPFASVLRAWCVPVLFAAMERSLKEGRDPVAGVNRELRGMTRFLQTAGQGGLASIDSTGSGQRKSENGARPDDIKEITGNHYGNLFKDFSSRSFWDEPRNLLDQRLLRNGISADDFLGRSVLDSGCGGGRYSAAWRLLGAEPVVGVDISPININDATRRTELANLDKISFKQGNVLDLPFAENEFDIVFSNGVLHHTTDWKKGVAELVRVLRPGGWGWLYLIESPGGVFWDVIEILRVVMKNEEKAASRSALQQINIPANRIFYMLDHVMVPINLRLAPKEIEDCLRSCGAGSIRRLNRGADIDRIEHIYSGTPYAVERFGVGENRYIFSKA